MAIYDLDSINEEMNTKKNNDLLDGLVETCNEMLSMIDESTAVQRHCGFTSKNLSKRYDAAEDMLRSSKLGNTAMNYVEKRMSNPAKAEKDAYKMGKYMHSGKFDKLLDKYPPVGDRGTGLVLSDREKKEAEIAGKAAGKAAYGAALARYAKKSGADVKSAYERGAAKGDEKRAKKEAIKETCEYILSVIDEM